MAKDRQLKQTITALKRAVDALKGAEVPSFDQGVAALSQVSKLFLNVGITLSEDEEFSRVFNAMFSRFHPPGFVFDGSQEQEDRLETHLENYLDDAGNRKAFAADLRTLLKIASKKAD